MPERPEGTVVDIKDLAAGAEGIDELLSELGLKSKYAKAATCALAIVNYISPKPLTFKDTVAAVQGIFDYTRAMLDTRGEPS